MFRPVDDGDDDLRGEPHDRLGVIRNFEDQLRVLLLVPQPGKGRNPDRRLGLTRLAHRIGDVVGGTGNDRVIPEHPENPFIAGVFDPLAQLNRLPENPLVFLGHLVPMLNDGGQHLDELRHLHRIGKDDPRFPLRLRQIPEALDGGSLIRLGVVDQRIETDMVDQKWLLEALGENRFDVRRDIGEDHPLLQEFMENRSRVLQEDHIGHEVSGPLLGQHLCHDFGGIHVEAVHLDARKFFLERFPELVDPR